MLDVDTKRRIDTARDILVGKVPDPKSQVEQITISLIYKFMDDMDKQVEELEGKPSFFQGEFAKYSWSRIFDPRISGHELVTLYGEAIDKMNLNPNIPQLFRDIFKNAYLPYRDPETLKSFLKIINEFHYSHSEKLGDAYEYLLSILSSQGDAGQFRTPRHIIDFIVEVVSPQKTDKVLDPACGTAGFLISSYKHILKENTDKRSGDKLKPEERNNLIKNFCGYDISPDMVRISLVNMYLHGFSNPKIYEYDTLTSEDRWNEYYDVILANPPFMSPKGGIKPHKKFSIQANRSEVLFVDYICEHLNPTGKAGIIVPEGIIFQSGKAYKHLRKMLVENYLWAVVSLPAGVFNPYAGVKTSILLIDKQLNKKSDSILFVKIENDGFDLGAQRREIDKNDLPPALQILKNYKVNLVIPAEAENRIILNNILLVPKEKIASKDDYSLSIDRYNIGTNINCDWEIVKLEEICDVRDGTHESPKYQLEGYPLVTSKNIKNGEIDFSNVNYISKNDLEKINKRSYVDNGDIIMPMIGTIGNPIIVRKNREFGIKNVALIKFYKDSKINNYFLKYILGSDNYLNKYQNSSGGSTQKFISLKYIRGLEIPLPPLSVQQEIVNKIESYQSIINGARQVVENYKPQIDINPEWDNVKLGELMSFEYGKPLKEENRKNGEHPVFGSNGIIGYHNEYLVKAPLIVIGRKGTAGAVNYYETNGYPIDTTFYAEIKYKNKLILKFAYFILKNLELNKINTQSGVPGLNRNDAYEKYFPLPSLEEQHQIVSRLEQEQKLIDANNELIKLYEQKIKDEINKIWKTNC